MTDFLSLCCNKPVATVCGNEGTNHFVCTECDNACDIRSDTQEKWVEELVKEIKHHEFVSGVMRYEDSYKWIFDFIRKTREEAKREVIQELKKDASDHLESSENLDIHNFWIDVREWLVIKQSDSLTSKQVEEGNE